MKAKTMPRHKYIGQLYKFVSKQKGSETSLEYYYAKDIAITTGLDKNNRMFVRSDEPLAIGFLIKEIKDGAGNLILSDTIWQINSIQPVLDAFSNLQGYTMNAIKYQGTL